MDREDDLNGKKTRIEQAETRSEQAESRTEQAKTRTEQAETRTEQAETRTELAKTRTEHAETRTEQAESRTEQAEAALQREVHKDDYQNQAIPMDILKEVHLKGLPDPAGLLAQLNGRQREVLQSIAAGRNTKQIAEDLKISPKTVEYHRMKLMNGLNLHDIPGLVRFAMQAGLLPQEN